jgi:hypothetical protein
VKESDCLFTTISLPAALAVPRAIYDLPEDEPLAFASSSVGKATFIYGLKRETGSHLNLPGTTKSCGRRSKQGLTGCGIGQGSGPEQADCIRTVAFVGVVRDVEELSERFQLGMLAGAE